MFFMVLDLGLQPTPVDVHQGHARHGADDECHDATAWHEGAVRRTASLVEQKNGLKLSHQEASLATMSIK